MCLLLPHSLCRWLCGFHDTVVALGPDGIPRRQGGRGLQDPTAIPGLPLLAAPSVRGLAGGSPTGGFRAWASSLPPSVPTFFLVSYLCPLHSFLQVSFWHWPKAERSKLRTPSQASPCWSFDIPLPWARPALGPGTLGTSSPWTTVPVPLPSTPIPSPRAPALALSSLSKPSGHWVLEGRRLFLPFLFFFFVKKKHRK